MALTSSVLVQIGATLTSDLDLATVTAPLTYRHRTALTSGTTGDEADLVFHDTRTLAAEGTENLDLAGVLTSALGATLTFVQIKALMVSAAAANTNNVVVTLPAANGVPLVSDSENVFPPVRPGGIALWFDPGDAGIAVTAGTGDLITITNSGAGTAVTYDVIILGTSA